MERVDCVVVGAGVIGLAVALALARRGRDVARLDAAAVTALEPALRCVAALHSPSTGIVDSHQYMLALDGDARAGGVVVAFGSPVNGGRVTSRGIELAIGGAEPMTLLASAVFNCAGLDAQRVARSIDPARAERFYPAIRRYWPDLPNGALVPDYAGIRPKIQAPHEPPKDFAIQGPADHGVDGLVNLYGIESPGLTASLAIADCAVGTLTGSAGPR